MTMPDIAAEQIMAAVNRLAELIEGTRDPPEVPLLLTARQAADLIGVGESTFRRKVAAGSMPKPVSVDGLTRWRRADLERAVAGLKPMRRRSAAEV